MSKITPRAVILFLLWANLPKPTTQKRCVKALAGKPCEDIYSLLQRNPNAGTIPGEKSHICYLQRMRFMNRCSDLLFEEQREPDCFGECHTFLNKISSKLRHAMFFCNCKENLDCIWFQKRTQRCMNQTLKYKKSCDTERQICQKDSDCVKLYAEWFQQCQDMFNGYGCTKQCQRAERDLYSHPLGKTLETCECAGSKTQENFCRSVRMRRTKLCNGDSIMADELVVHGETSNAVTQKYSSGSETLNVRGRYIAWVGLCCCFIVMLVSRM